MILLIACFIIVCMDAFPKHYIAQSMPDITLNQFREKLPIEQAMQLDMLIKGQLIREIAKINYNDETTRKFFDGTLREKD